MSKVDQINKVLDNQFIKAKIIADEVIPILKTFNNCVVTGPFSRDTTVSLGYITLATFSNPEAASESFKDILKRCADKLIKLMPKDNPEQVKLLQKNCSIGIVLGRRRF